VNHQSQCQSGSVVVAPSTTTESPFVMDQCCIRYKNAVILKINQTSDGPIISYHDQIEIVKALNAAYQFGYSAGFSAPKFI